jgi:hypothetical protein
MRGVRRLVPISGDDLVCRRLTRAGNGRGTARAGVVAGGEVASGAGVTPESRAFGSRFLSEAETERSGANLRGMERLNRLENGDFACLSECESLESPY